MSFLPFTTLQATYPEVFNDISSSLIESDTVWLSIYQGNAPNASIHSKLNLSATKHDTKDSNTSRGVRIEKFHVKGTERFKVEREQGTSLNLQISLPPSSSSTISSSPQYSARKSHSQITLQSTLLQLPRRVLSSKFPGALGITASDLSPTGNGLLVLGAEDGWLEVRNLNSWDGEASSGPSNLENQQEEEEYSNEEERIEALAQRRIREKLGNGNGAANEFVKLKGHKGDIRSVKFFPSGEVVLSTSSDSTARIFSALDGSNPRTLKGHKRAIMCSEFIDRGKEVLTGSMDGTIRLWNVSEEKQIGIWGSDRYSGIECMKLIKSKSQEQQILLLGLSSSKIHILDLKSSKTLRLLNLPLFPPGEKPNATDSWKQTTFGAITSLDYDEDSNWIVVGGRNGATAIYDLKKLELEEEVKVEKMEEISNPNIREEKVDWNEKAMIALWKRNDATVNEVKFIKIDDSQIPDLLVSTADGLPHRISLSNLSKDRNGGLDSISDPESQPRVKVEYCGWEVENTQSILFDPSFGRSGRIVVAGAHGEVRIY